jgi:hypothetical protein
VSDYHQSDFEIKLWLKSQQPVDPLCGVAGERPALCGRGSGLMNANQLTLSAVSLVNALLSAAGVLV